MGILLLPKEEGGKGRGIHASRPLILDRSLLSGGQRAPGLSVGWERGVSFIARELARVGRWPGGGA